MKSHKVYTSYFDNINKGIGVKISIARFPPKSDKTIKKVDKWLYDLAPSIELLNDYKGGKIDWETYKFRYDSETKYEPFMCDLFLLLETLKDSDVTLYCYETPNENCHRHLLGELLKKLGYEVIEI